MKKIGSYTIRGQSDENESESGIPKRVRLFDGRFDTGYRITKFQIFGATYTGTQPFVIGKVATTDNLNTTTTNFFNANDIREIGWSVSAGATDGGADIFADTVLDRDNMIVEDLFIYVRGNTDAAFVNYYIEMDKYEFPTATGALTMVRNNAQNVTGDN
jgi:hypothetical protein